MIVLAVDTCLGACSAALIDGDRVLATVSEPMLRGHQERLAPMVAELMTQAGVAFTKLDRVGATVGPGSFTGLRVGLAFAKGMAAALDIACVGVGSLDALAADHPGLVLAIADARRDQAYWQAFHDGAPITEPAATHLDDAKRWLATQAGIATIVGPGAELLAGHGQVILTQAPDPAAVARLAAHAGLGSAMPIYLRAPDAKLPGGRTLEA